MHACMYGCMYVCMCVCVYMYIYIYKYIYIYGYIRISSDISIGLKLDLCLLFRQGAIPSGSQDFSESWASCCRSHIHDSGTELSPINGRISLTSIRFRRYFTGFSPSKPLPYDIYIYTHWYIYIYNYIHITIYVVICDTDVKWCMHKTYIILHRWHLWPQAFPAHAKPRRGLQGGDEGRSFLRHFSTSILDMLSESDMGHGFTKQENFCGLSSPRGVYRKPGCWFQELESKCWSIHMDKYPSSWPDLQFLSMTAIPSRQAASNLGNA